MKSMGGNAMHLPISAIISAIALLSVQSKGN